MYQTVRSIVTKKHLTLYGRRAFHTFCFPNSTFRHFFVDLRCAQLYINIVLILFSFVVIDYFHICSQSSIYSVSVPFQESEKILTFLFPSCLPCCRKWQIFVFRVLIHWIFWISGGMQLGGIYCKWALKIKFHFQLLSKMQVLHEKHKEIPPHERSYHFYRTQVRS